MTRTLALDTLCRLMSSDLPQTINPLRLARADALLKGQLNIGEMQRLSALVTDRQGQVDFELNFSQDADGQCYVKGHCATTISMSCQRCFQPISVDIATPTRLIVVLSIEAARDVPEEYEPLLFTGDEIDLINMVEEEILLALPISPRHDTAECHAAEEIAELRNEKPGPFSVLKDLKY
ncbi:MAG: YceD family protein [Gammaproteobacteria bacterium]|nr:YceD family protein [Gammaproteobacteria bacterium]